MKTNVTYVLLACMLAFSQFCGATITLSPVQVAASTCPNNGTAVVHAHSNRNNAVFLYNIVSGPVLYSLQNDSVFASLYPGTYSGWVHDVNSFDSAAVNFTITGNYTDPVVSATIQAPLCLNGNNGQITCIIVPGTGLGPFTWAMFSPYTTAPQQSSVFSGLTAGTYIIRLTDACNISRSVSAVLDTDGTQLQLLTNNSYPYIEITGCGDIVFTSFYSIDKNKAYVPLTLTVQTGTHTFVSSIMPQAYDTTDVIPSVYILTDTITGVDFTGMVQVTLTDACNQSISFTPVRMPEFNFGLTFIADSTGCGGYTATIVLNFQNSDSVLGAVVDDLPLSVTLQNTATGAVVGSYTAADQSPLEYGCYNCPVFGHEPDTTEFTLTVTDQCGHRSQTNVYWPSLVSPSVWAGAIGNGCLDSTAQAEFFFNGFGAVVNLTILSGPNTSQSSNPDFAYSNNINYPVSFTGISGGLFYVNNMPPGFYTYRVTDLCGHIYNDTFSIPPVYGLEPVVYNRSNCNGTSTLILASLWYQANVTLVTGDEFLPLQIVDDQYLEARGLLPGPYELNLQYLPGNGVPLPGNGGCSSLRKVFTVPYYNDSIIRTTDVATCNGNIYLTIQADTNNGPVPFMYEILSGPETYGLQASNTFQVSSFGTYLVGATDSCGNEDTRYVTVDTGRFNGPVRSGGLCAGDGVQLTEDASPYFTYSWRGPNGVTRYGNPITISPFTNADTGYYLITRYVNINGCSDSAKGSYYVGYVNKYYQTVTQCPLDTLWVGGNAHIKPGVYTDTLSGAGGCDSIEISTLNILPAIPVHITQGDTALCYTSYLILTATGADNYEWPPFQFYEDSFYVYPVAPTVYTVIGTDNNSPLCPGTASILVYPPTDSAQLLQNFGITCGKNKDTICAAPGYSSYLWSNGSTGQCLISNTPGNYTVTVTEGNGCTAVSGNVVIELLPQPVISRQGDLLTCTGSYSSYQWLLNGVAIPGAEGTSLIATAPGSYSVEVSNGTGCTSTSSSIIVASVSTIAGDGSRVTVYPNPAGNGNWHVEINAALTGALCRIYDVEGNTVYSTILTGTETILNTNLAAGTYVMRVSTGQEIYNIKLAGF